MLSEYITLDPCTTYHLHLCCVYHKRDILVLGFLLFVPASFHMHYCASALLTSKVVRNQSLQLRAIQPAVVLEAGKGNMHVLLVNFMIVYNLRCITWTQYSI
jgi:hypothetical protein